MRPLRSGKVPILMVASTMSCRARTRRSSPSFRRPAVACLQSRFSPPIPHLIPNKCARMRRQTTASAIPGPIPEPSGCPMESPSPNSLGSGNWRKRCALAQCIDSRCPCEPHGSLSLSNSDRAATAASPSKTPITVVPVAHEASNSQFRKSTPLRNAGPTPRVGSLAPLGQGTTWARRNCGWL
jgi:hypothetical protein